MTELARSGLTNIEQKNFVDGYSALLFNHRKKDSIPDIERQFILNSIFDCISLSLPDELKSPINILAIASYPIVDLLSNIGKNCNWYLFYRDGKNVAIELDYKGEHNYRQFFYGEKRAILDIVNYYHLLENAFDKHPNDFRPVLPAYLFDLIETHDLIKENWESKHGWPPQTMTRMVNNLETYSTPNEVKKIVIPENYTLRELVTHDGTDDGDSIRELFESAEYSQYSNHGDEQYFGLVDPNKVVISTSATVGQVLPKKEHLRFPEIPNLNIFLTGNMSTRAEFKGKGYAHLVRDFNLRKLKEKYHKGIVIADANQFSFPINKSLKFNAVADFYWLTLSRKK